MSFKIAWQPTLAAGPCRCAFHDPVLGEDDEFMPRRPLDDFHDPPAGGDTRTAARRPGYPSSAKMRG
jgi:hypothetical protein